MTNDVTDKRLAKIQALLAQAESTNFPEEAKTFTEKAQALMTEWAIDDAMLAHAKGATDATAIERVLIVIGFPPYQGTKEGLLTVIARNNDVRIVLTSRRVQGKDKKRGMRNEGMAYLIGTPQDLEFVQMLYTSCLLQADVEFLTEAVQTALFAETSHPGHRIKWRNTYMQGYAAAIGRRLREARKATTQKAEAHTPGVGLVLASKSQLVDARVNDMFGKLGKASRSYGGAAGSGYGHGQAAGNRANLGQPGVSGSKGALQR